MLDDIDHEPPPLTRPIYGHNYQLDDAKRRRTGEKETVEQALVWPVEAPPIRYSNIRKVNYLFSSVYSC